MKTLSLISLLVLIFIINFQCFSQYPIGHRQVTYIDSARSNRSIQTELYYPATTAGDNVAIAAGQFPIIIFGHGFMMAWSSYQNFWDSIVPHGYIMAFPRTEGNMTPNHSNFGLDLAFLLAKLKNEGTTSSSFLYQKVTATSAIAGHSMGGGSSFLACQNNTIPTTMITFAAANTTPSSITAASKISIPSLIFSGANDGVAPPAQHQQPMYDSCTASCKTFISITGGGHCYFANSDFYCSFGEGTTSPQPTITREQEQTSVNFLLFPYLDYLLKNDQTAGTLFLSRLATNADITYQRNCSTTKVTSTNLPEKTNLILFPNPASELLNISCLNPELINKPINISIINITGKMVYAKTILSEQKNSFDISSIAKGIYTVKVDCSSNAAIFRVVIY